MESDRPAIFAHIISKFGADKTARVASFGTLKDRAVIDEIGRALARNWDNEHPGEDKNPYSLPIIEQIKKDYDSDPEKTKKKNKELFYYFDGLLDTKISQSVHPAGMVISPITLHDNYGTFDKDGDICLMMDMDEAHEVGGAKYDLTIKGRVYSNVHC